MKPSTIIVVYKDRSSAQALYFGPFVDIRIAGEFSSALPEPLTGGFKVYRTLQRFTSQDGSIVNDLIMSYREQVGAHA